MSDFREHELGAFLLDLGLVSPADLAVAIEENKKSGREVGEILLAKGIVSEEELVRARAHIFALPLIDLADRTFDLEVLSLIPEPLSRRLSAIAFRQEGSAVDVAMLDPETISELAFLEREHGLAVRPYLSSADSMKRGLIAYQRALGESFGQTIGSRAALAFPDGRLDEAALTELADGAAAAELLEALIAHALLQGATRVHLDPGEHSLVVRYRTNGRLEEAMVLPKTAAFRLGLRLRRLSGVPLAAVRPAEGGFVLDRGEERIAVRFLSADAYYGEQIVLVLEREIGEGKGNGFSLEALGLRGQALNDLYAALERRSGLVLVSGPSDSGKTTLLYMLLARELERPGRHVVSIEEGIEYSFPRATQIPLRPEEGFGYPEALRAAIRLRPDVLFVADIDKAESARLAASAALQGMLVIAGVAADDAVEALSKVRGLSDGALLAPAVLASVATRLVPKIGDDRESYYLSGEELRSLSKLTRLELLGARLREEGFTGSDNWEHIAFAKPQSGRTDREAGRIGMHEVVPVTANVRDLLAGGATDAQVREEALRAGMLPLLEDGLIKAVLGHVTLEDVLRTAPVRVY